MDEESTFSISFFDFLSEVIGCYVLAYITYYLIVHRMIDLQNCKEHSLVNGQEITADYAPQIEKHMKNIYPDSRIVVYGYPKSEDAKGLSKLLMLNQKNMEAKKKAIQNELKRKKYQ
uniref:Transposase n=1 Tax=Strongyloides papillosus TaxID=174720 RepID=A0A0N5C420_STREA